MLHVHGMLLCHEQLPFQQSWPFFGCVAGNMAWIVRTFDAWSSADFPPRPCPSLPRYEFRSIKDAPAYELNVDKFKVFEGSEFPHLLTEFPTRLYSQNANERWYENNKNLCPNIDTVVSIEDLNREHITKLPVRPQRCRFRLIEGSFIRTQFFCDIQSAILNSCKRRVERVPALNNPL